MARDLRHHVVALLAEPGQQSLEGRGFAACIASPPLLRWRWGAGARLAWRGGEAEPRGGGEARWEETVRAGEQHSHLPPSEGMPSPPECVPDGSTVSPSETDT